MSACDQVESLASEVYSAEPSEVETLYHDYVNAYLECNSHPEDFMSSSTDLKGLAKEIVESLNFSKESVTEQLTENQLASIVLARENMCVDPSQANVSKGADPVMMFNGQFLHEAQDVSIDGAGIDFIFTRTYKNQVTYDGPIGFNWDHNYNLWLRVANHTIFRSTGNLREEAYIKHPRFGEEGFKYWIPPGGQHAVIIENGPSFTWRAPNGVRHFYEQDEHPFLHHLSRIEDRYGNYLHFSYLEGKLRQVKINHPHRIVNFEYNPQNRIIQIQDHTLRRWCYFYDFFGDLIAVTTPGTNRYPGGLTVCYEYSSVQFTGKLQHNLTRIIDPAGQMYLENEYGTEPGRLRFNRVIRQRQGAGESLFEYENIVPEFEHDYNDAERPVHQTTMVERNGHPVHYIYNKFGNLLFKEEYILENGSLRLLMERYRYNRDGALIATLSPEGIVWQHLYGREYFVRLHGLTDNGDVPKDDLTLHERQRFGHLLATVKRGRYYTLTQLNLARDVWGDIFPDVISGFDAGDIVIKFTYEPVYRQLLTVSDPRFTNSPDPAVQTAAAGEHDRYEENLTRYVYTGPASDPTRLLAEIRRPTPTLPDGTLGNEVVETFEAYDERGRLLRHINPVGTLTINTYFDDSAGKREGFPRRTVVDPDGLAITTEYNMDELGRVTEVHLPRSVDAPAGQFVIGLKYNPLDQLTQLTTPGPFAFKTRRFYDPNGKLEREENDAKDETGADIPDAPSVSAFCYDSEFNLTKTTIGGSDRSAHLITRHCYDSAGQRVLTLLPKGNQVRTRYDERLLPVTRILGDGTENAATSRTEYDGDGRVRRTFDARGNPNTFLLDPFDRVIAEENALGHIIRHDYDNSGNVRFVRVFEKREDGYYLLSRSQTDYDELGRAIATGMNRFDDPPGPHQKDNLKNAFLVSPGPGELLVSRTFYDAGGRVERAIDALGRETHFEYDTLDRVKVQIDPLGNRVENHYDAHGNLIRLDRHDLVRDPETGDVSGHRFFSTSSTYDQLDRMVTSIDSLGNVTRYAYNSRDNLVRRIDALGNVVQTEFDIYNRRVAEKRLQKDTGLGGGIPLAPPEAVDRFQYDDNSNLVTVTDALTRHTNYTFDPLDRRRAIIYPDGRQTTFDYDPDGNLLLTRDNNGLQRHFTVDRLGRTTRVDVDKTGTVIEVEGATFEVYSYDGLDRRYHEENDFARCDIRFNSLDWPVEEVITFNTPEEPLVAPLLIAREFNHVGAVTGLIYPNGRRLHFHRDDLDRLTRVENLVKGTNYPGHSDTPDGHDIAKMEYLGRQRSRCIFGNGAQASYAYDGAARSIEIAHTSPVEPLMRFQYLFDAVGNMRFRNDIEPPGNIGEAFKYDSFYRLANEAFEDKTPFDTASFAPAATLPPDPIPDRQADINSHIGPLELPTGVMTFDYDLVSNRKTEQLADGGDAIYEKNNLDQYIEREETLSGDSASFQYDGNGNLKSDGTRDYIYDSLNRLVKMIGPAGDVRFFHDARGRCIFESGIAGKTHLVWDDTNLIAEYREGNPFTHYVHDDVVDRPLQIVVKVFGGASHELWYHTDLTGSVRMLTDRDGNVVATYRYNPFGQVLEISGGDLYNPVRYAGRRLDEDLGTYDFRARQYDPQIGRFLQRDPLGIVDGTNLYMYTANNPLVFADPFGTDKRPEFEQSGQLDELWCDADTAAEEEAQLWKMRLNPPSSIGPAPHPSQIYVEYKNWYNSDYYFREYRPMYEKVSDSKQKVFNVPVEDIAPPPGHYTNNPFQTVPFEVGYIYRRIDTTGNLLPYVGQSETREKMYNRWYRQDYPNSSFIYQVIDRALWAPKPRRGTISSPLDIAEESNIRAEGGPWVYEGNLSNLRYQVNLELYEHLGGNIPRPTNNKRIPERWELRPKPARSRRPPPRASRARK